MFKYNNSTLVRIETLLREGGYTVRYERGNFNSGYCVLENRKVIVINRYFENEARINNLIEILSSLNINPDSLSDISRDFFYELQHLNLRA